MPLVLVTYRKIAGGAALFWIALKLLAPEQLESTDESGKALCRTNRAAGRDVLAAADLVLSLDNVIAVAAAASGNVAC